MKLGLFLLTVAGVVVGSSFAFDGTQRNVLLFGAALLLLLALYYSWDEIHEEAKRTGSPSRAIAQLLRRWRDAWSERHYGQIAPLHRSNNEKRAQWDMPPQPDWWECPFCKTQNFGPNVIQCHGCPAVYDYKRERARLPA